MRTPLLVVAIALSLATPASADVEVDGQHWHNIFVQGRRCCAVHTLPFGDARQKLVAFDECFVGVAGPTTRLGFDQNRAFVGVLHQLAPRFCVEGGYLHVNIGSERLLPTFHIQTAVNLV